MHCHTLSTQYLTKVYTYNNFLQEMLCSCWVTRAQNKHVLVRNSRVFIDSIRVIPVRAKFAIENTKIRKKIRVCLLKTDIYPCCFIVIWMAYSLTNMTHSVSCNSVLYPSHTGQTDTKPTKPAKFAMNRPAVGHRQCCWRHRKSSRFYVGVISGKIRYGIARFETDT